MLADSRREIRGLDAFHDGYADGFAPVEIQRPQKEEDEDDGGMFSGSIVVSETLSGSGQKTEQKPNLTLLGLLSPQMNKLTDGTWEPCPGPDDHAGRN